MSRNKNALLRIVTSFAALVAAIILFYLVSATWYIEFGVFFAIYLLIGYDIVAKAIGGIGRGQLFDENFLMVLATVGAFATKQYPEAVAVILLYQVGELFQRYAVGKSRGSISNLMNMCPDSATVLRNGEYLKILPEEVQVGETIIVKPGERVPLDGTIIKGESALDTSALTGESVLRDCSDGDFIMSGMIVMSGMLEIRVDKAFYDSTVSKILELVENATGKKARTEKFITKFARFYTPIVVTIALLMAFVLPILGGHWNVWIGKAMNFLVVSCPCALVISVPMTFFAGIGAASKQGILVKGGSCLELLSKADTFVFDKTGTLTEGKFSVVKVFPEERKEEILQMAAIAEQGSVHPIAVSIIEAAGVPDDTRWTLKEKIGHGVCAQKENSVICVGNKNFLEEQGVIVTEAEYAGTVLYVAKDRTLLGYIEIADKPKTDAAETIAHLKDQKNRTIMLTGDRTAVAEMVASRIGIDSFEAELLPGDKLACVEKLLTLKDKKCALVFVGDGINDAPVIMRADVGIAMGGIGSDAAIEAADIVLMHDRLSAVVTAKNIAKKTMNIAMQNIVFALTIKLMVLMLTPFGLVSIWLAIFADVGVAVLAILNAMRAGRMVRRANTH